MIHTKLLCIEFMEVFLKLEVQVKLSCEADKNIEYDEEFRDVFRSLISKLRLSDSFFEKEVILNAEWTLVFAEWVLAHNNRIELVSYS